MKANTPLAKAAREAAWALEVFGGLVAFYGLEPRPGQWCSMYPKPHLKHGNCPGIPKALRQEAT